MNDSPCAHWDSHHRRCATAVLDQRHGVRVDQSLCREVGSTSARAFNSGSPDVMTSILALWFKRAAPITVLVDREKG